MPTLTLAHRFALAVGVPTLFLLVFAGLHVSVALREARAASAVEQGVDVVQAAGDLVHELQKERGLTAGLIGAGGGGRFAELLADQRRATDDARAAFAGELAAFEAEGVLGGDAAAAAAGLDALGETRAAADAGALSLGDMAGWYTPRIEALIALAPTLRRGVEFGAGESLLAGYAALTQAKEQAGIERALGANGFGSGRFTPDLHARFSALAVRQEVLLDAFSEAVDAELGARMTALREGAESEAVRRLRAAARDGMQLGFINGVDGPDWFAAATARIDVMKEVENSVAAALNRLSEAAQAAAWNDAALSVAGLAAALLAAAGIALFSVRGTVSPLRAISGSIEAMQSGEEGDLSGAMLERRDEIGVLARNAMAMRRTTDRMHRISAALDVSAGPIVVCNPRFYVTYANPAFSRMLAPSRAFFQARGGNIDEITGRNIDDFHAGKGHIRNMLERLTGEHHATIGFDDRLFDISASPIIDANGRKLGYVLVWTDVSETRRLESQLKELIGAARRGDFTRRIETETENPFLRDVAAGLNDVSGIIAAFAEDLQRTVAAMAEGDLTRKVAGRYEGVLGELAGGVNETMDRLSALVSDIKSAGGRVRGASDEIAEGAGSLAERAESQAAALEQTAALMEEMTGSVKANAESAAAARKEAADADARADADRGVVQETVAAMSRLTESSRRMTEIVDVIASIATQTNLLALNAAVEAARAGDAGKGFAVVATEVGALARRSREAADDIRGLIGESAERVESGVGLVERTGAALSEMAEALRRISEGVGRIDAASREQANGVEEINQAVAQMDETTQRNAALADTSARAARQLASESEQLDRLTAMFRTASTEGRPAADGRRAA